MGSVYVVGYFGASNLGDDLLLIESMTLILRQIEESRLVIVSHPNSYIKNYFPSIRQISPGSFIRLRLSSKDKVVFAGGGQFSNFGQPSFFNLWGFIDFLSVLGIRFIIWRWVNRVRGFPFLIGVGPTRGIGARLGLKLLHISLEAGSVRDKHSNMHLKNCIQGYDPVLASSNFTLKTVAQKDYPARKIGLLLRNWDEPNVVVDFAKRLITALGLLGVSDSQICLVSFQENYDSAIYEDDCFINFETYFWNPLTASPQEYISGLSSFDHLFSMRAHGVFLAARAQISVTPILIEPKIAIAAEQVGLNDKGIKLNSTNEDFMKIELFNSLPDSIFRTHSDNNSVNRQLAAFLCEETEI
jgi:polysaccharide pyruvyl transferase WcaK-like protein